MKYPSPEEVYKKGYKFQLTAFGPEKTITLNLQKKLEKYMNIDCIVARIPKPSKKKAGYHWAIFKKA